MPPKKQGRPQLPPSDNKELDERRKYYREWQQKRRKELLILAQNANEDYDLNKKLKGKHEKCTKIVNETKKKLIKCQKHTKEIINEYDKAIKKIQDRK